MDPITHVLAGTLIASFSGNQLSIADPIFLAAILGSLAPDGDIIYQVKGDMAYLKKHRGFSHSFIGFAVISAGIAGLLKLIFPETAFITLFFWAFLGNLSHGFLDYLNSYGAQLFWPLNKKRINLGILTIFDPILFLLMLVSVFGQMVNSPLREIGSIGVLLYLLFRLYMRYKAHLKIRERFPSVKKIVVLPSVVSIWNWHFLLENHNKITVGEVRFLSWTMKIRRSFRKHKNNSFIQVAINSKLGKLFQEFTPIFHVDYKRKNNRHFVNFIDLRYYVRNDFMHHATGIVDENNNLMEGIFQPYSKDRKIKITG